ncbi:MAG: sensor domain-containing diguanylate cyclase [Clostridiales bacterium]|nr:sensor domain-containing diguanylate cyclase [Clostridiales bacterium]
MTELNSLVPDNLLQTVPGGIAKLALDDVMTILYATDNFIQMIRTVADKSGGKKPESLLRMVYSADIIYVTHQIATQKSRKDNGLSINFRSLQQDGSMKWILINGNRTDEVYQSGTKSVPVYACIATDITALMVEYKKLEQKNDYQRVIAELSKDLFFEYEIATDTLTFTEQFREITGGNPVITGFRNKLGKTNKIHADERSAVAEMYTSLMSGRKQVRFEVRILTKDGGYSWYTCYASIILDENRNPYKVVGKLSTSRMVARELKSQVEPVRDPLTQVYTKEAAEAMIIEALAQQKKEAIGALLLIDIRNYKGLDEIMKAISGENLLAQIGKMLRNKFRLTDIIGRTGVSEFAVYLKDLPSDKIAYEIADSLCAEISGLYPYGHTRNGLYASIGIAFAKGEVQYQTLYANANTALVMAKKVSSASFEVFSAGI